jgi:hypothetical protein
MRRNSAAISQVRRVLTTPVATSRMYRKSRGGGNCTRGPISVNIYSRCGYDMASGDWPEHGREDEALRELVSNWHRLSPSGRDAIMAQVRTSQRWWRHKNKAILWRLAVGRIDECAPTHSATLMHCFRRPWPCLLTP